MFVKRIVVATVTAIGATTAVVAAHAGTSTVVQPVAASVPAFDHIVLVMFENKKYSTINGSSSASYFNQLAAKSAKFTKSFAITHPSQPNYVALFSGSTQGIKDDDCVDLGAKANLATQLTGTGKSFTGYSEGMPS